MSAASQQSEILLPGTPASPPRVLRPSTLKLVGKESNNWRDVFAELNCAEIAAMLENLFAILPQRGCHQCCAGCHASAARRISTASWEKIAGTVKAIGEASHHLRTPVQSRLPQASRILETFRDSDPAHYRFLSVYSTSAGENRYEARGIGDFSRLIFDTLGVPVKIMTSGVWVGTVDGALSGTELSKPSAWDLSQLRTAARYAGRVSVSASKQTMQYRKLRPLANASILAHTLTALLEGAPHYTPVFLDMMSYSPYGLDAHTEETRLLAASVVGHIAESVLSENEKARIIDYLAQPIDGSKNNAWQLKGRNFGVRISPYINTGRAIKDAQRGVGQKMQEISVSNLLTLLPGRTSDLISLQDGSMKMGVTRKDLGNASVMHEFASFAKEAAKKGFLAETAKVSGNWFSFFRSEMDLSPGAGMPSARMPQSSPGMNTPSGLNLLLSDVKAGDLQVVLPFKRIHI